MLKMKKYAKHGTHQQYKQEESSAAHQNNTQVFHDETPTKTRLHSTDESLPFLYDRYTTRNKHLVMCTQQLNMSK